MKQKENKKAPKHGALNIGKSYYKTNEQTEYGNTQ